MTITEFLQTKVPFLEGIPAEQASFLAKKALQEPFKKGATIIFAGTSVEGLNIIAQGKVAVMIRPKKGKPFEMVAELSTGEVFGETSIIEFKMAGAQIKSAADDTLVFVIPQAAFREMLDQNPDFKARTLKLIEDRQAARHGDDKRNDAQSRDDSEQEPSAEQPAAEQPPAEQPAAEQPPAEQPSEEQAPEQKEASQ